MKNLKNKTREMSMLPLTLPQILGRSENITQKNWAEAQNILVLGFFFF